VLLASAARPDAVLDVSGSVVATAPRLEVRVTLTNRGDVRAGPIDVRGELFGESREARLPGGIAPAAEGHVRLDFAPTPPRPGLHALTLLLEHPVEGPPDGAGNPPVSSQRAFLLLALGANPGEAVRIAAEPLSLDVRGILLVRLESRDGQGQRVSLRALTARGLRPDGDPIEVAVPPRGHATAQLPLARAGAPRGSRQALLLVAEALDGPLARTSVAAASVDLLSDPARLPRLRVPFLVGGLALFAFALVYELRARSRARPSFRA
jgi:hypothetical protein